MECDTSNLPEWEKTVSEFVMEVCRNRDPTHGWDHAKCVVANARAIMKGLDMDDPETEQIIVVIAWLHDVADYKYDPDRTLYQKLVSFLSVHYPNNAIFMVEIIDRISFSREKKDGRSNWERILGHHGMFIRDIVSDADKLEAIGKVGLERCIKYGSETYPDWSPSKLKKRVRTHAEEKILLLNDHYIHTLPGKKMAQPLHEEFVRALEEYETEML